MENRIFNQQFLSYLRKLIHTEGWGAFREAVKNRIERAKREGIIKNGGTLSENDLPF